MDSKQLPILIVGGGMGGMSTALALAQKGFSSLILEQADQFRETGAGVQVCPNVFKMYEMLNMAPLLNEISFFPESLVYLDGISGQEFVRLPLGQQLRAHFGYPFGVFHRENFMRSLVKECKKSPFIQFAISAKVKDFEEVNEKVIVRTENGAVFEGAALIGADGLFSTIRERMIGDKIQHSGHIACRGVIPIDKIPENLRFDSVYHWTRPKAHLVHYPLKNEGLFNIVAIFQSSKQCDLSAPIDSAEEMHQSFEGSRIEVLTLLSMLDAKQMWRLCDRDPISEWSQGRITLLGDAAHPTLPYVTQGVGMAIEDALVLAHNVEHFKGDYASAFQAYQKNRYLRTGAAQLLARLYGEINHASGVARQLRNTILSTKTVQECYDWLAYMYQAPQDFS